MKTLIAGHTTHDHYQGGFAAGGCAFYGAKVHHALDRLAARARCPRTDGTSAASVRGHLALVDGHTHLVTVVGHDFTRDDELSDLDATVHRQGQTTVFANYYPDDAPRIQLLEAMAPEVTPDMVSDTMLDADLVHLAPVLGEIDLLRWKDAVGDGLLAINVQGWIKVPGPVFDASELEGVQQRGVTGQAHRVVQQFWDVTEEDFRGVDIACLSEEDVIDQPGLLDKLVRAVPIVAYTLGEQGSRIYVDGEPTEVGIYPTDAVDPTGAGDTFAASFCHQIAAGHAPVDAARFAAACASIVVEDIGARALTRLDEAEGRMEAI
ncbi:hypothetical protein FIV42_09250 [Persicimonas caeni]|uniref:Carbohydrate kinase PfkB domain-containing protein n=1 Tax=Persicimonas caeni TaxID=2292766 RepID=A0A4Y6PRE9_PERCE|nr:PfkB family carbohydrate kinase [Persicimonas caeni]QDG50912.1 hypothetical protein FIV42_09250 [Persicimonas caeni]QED32133.1 hypothetical protein FRD00_09245 [Persicimonas caeni]